MQGLAGIRKALGFESGAVTGVLGNYAYYTDAVQKVAAKVFDHYATKWVVLAVGVGIVYRVVSACSGRRANQKFNEGRLGHQVLQDVGTGISESANERQMELMQHQITLTRIKERYGVNSFDQ